MKKLLLILLVLVCFVLVSCGTQTEEPNDKDTPVVETPDNKTPEQGGNDDSGNNKTPEQGGNEDSGNTDEKTPEQGGNDDSGDTLPEVDPNAPTFAVGWNDAGYSTTLNSSTGEYTINKSATAAIWTGAMLDIFDYTSAYSSFNLKITTTNVTLFSIELIIAGGESGWAENVNVYSTQLTDGEHEISVDFSKINPVSTANWSSVPGYYIKDYTISAIKFSLDTAVDSSLQLVKENATCVINELKFVKVQDEEQGGNNNPDQGENQQPEVDPNAPTLSIGWNDLGYSTTKNSASGEYTIKKSATAGKWTGASFEINGFESEYSAFTINFTTTNVTLLSIELIVNGLDASWTPYVNVYSGRLTDGEHTLYIDFTNTNCVDGTTWESVLGYYIKNYDVSSIKISLDTAVDNDSDLVKEDATCIIHSLTFKKIEQVEEPSYEDEIYVPTESILSFSDENEDKVITEPTFDVNAYTNPAGTNIKPYELFGSGMCLQRDAINRIWGTCENANYIAAEIRGKIYYGTVTNGEWEIYLPKMNAGGPYKLTIYSDLGRLIYTDVYVGEVYVLSGQSNMEYTLGSFSDVLGEYYATPDCINTQIRMYQVGWHLPTTPSTEGLKYSQWTYANQSSIEAFSAVGYLFGKQMQEELGCPVGLIYTPVGGSSIEFWLSEENYNKVSEIYTPYVTSETVLTPSLGYNGRLYPLSGLNVRGVLWYQGESNAFGTENYYDQALEIFIDQCREMFNNDKLAFTICELARYEYNPLAYSIINEKINLVANNDPYIVVARNLDKGEWTDIHPKDKRVIASRAADETLRVFFGYEKATPITVSSYEFNSDGTVTITLSSDATLVNGTNGFEVYVNGAYTYECNVVINGNKLTVSASGEITKVRYGYTCQMTNEIKLDVSKMVTVYDLNGLPLDLFTISK